MLDLKAAYTYLKKHYIRSRCTRGAVYRLGGIRIGTVLSTASYLLQPNYIRRYILYLAYRSIERSLGIIY